MLAPNWHSDNRLALSMRPYWKLDTPKVIWSQGRVVMRGLSLLGSSLSSSSKFDLLSSTQRFAHKPVELYSSKYWFSTLPYLEYFGHISARAQEKIIYQKEWRAILSILLCLLLVDNLHWRVIWHKLDNILQTVVLVVEWISHQLHLLFAMVGWKLS